MWRIAGEAAAAAEAAVAAGDENRIAREQDWQAAAAAAAARRVGSARLKAEMLDAGTVLGCWNATAQCKGRLAGGGGD